MNKVFMTGATGLLGNNLVRELLARNYEVTAMIQPGIPSDSLTALGVSAIECDLLDRDTLFDIIKGHSIVIHVAAYTAVWPSRDQIHWDVNATGTKNMIEAAMEASVDRFISVGSASSFGFGTKDAPGTEETKPFIEYGLDYIDSKKEGQNMVIEAARNGLPAIVVNPTFMIGPHDYGPSSGAMIVAAAKGKIPGFSSGGKNWVYVKDVAVGICNGITKGRIGECYLLGHENLSYKEAITMISEEVGVKPPKITWPDFIMKTIGGFGTFFGNLTGRKPQISLTMAKIACDGHYFSPQKAIEELELPQTPVRQAVREAFEWFKENKYV